MVRTVTSDWIVSRRYKPIFSRCQWRRPHIFTLSIAMNPYFNAVKSNETTSGSRRLKSDLSSLSFTWRSEYVYDFATFRLSSVLSYCWLVWKWRTARPNYDVNATWRLSSDNQWVRSVHCGLWNLAMLRLSSFQRKLTRLWYFSDGLKQR